MLENTARAVVHTIEFYLALTWLTKGVHCSAFWGQSFVGELNKISEQTREKKIKVPEAPKVAATRSVGVAK
jgi:hypothetical protein